MNLNDASVIFVGGVPNELEKELLHSKSLGQPQVAAENFQMEFYKSLREMGFKEINFISLPYTGAYKISTNLKRYEPTVSSEGDFRFLPFHTFPGLYSLTRKARVKSELLKTLDQANSNYVFIFVYAAHLPFMEAVLEVANNREAGVYSILILPDLPAFSRESVSIKGKVFNGLKRLYFRNFIKMADRYSGHIVFAKPMLDYLGSEKESYFILHGLPPKSELNLELFSASVKKELYELKNMNSKTFLYAGSLSFRYGIRDMVEAFIELLEIGEDLKLYVFGGGEASSFLIDVASKYKQIKYCGVRPHKEVLAFQSEVDFLLNPRKPSEDFVQYSFPSKMLEYCRAEKPIIAYDFPSYPKQLKSALICPESNDKKGLIHAIEYSLKLTPGELIKKGNSAGYFLREYASQKYFKAGVERLLNLIVRENR